MPQIRLAVVGHPAVEFDGELLVRVQSARDPSITGVRGYDLAVYTRDDGGYVATIDFVSTVPAEENRSLVETVDSISNVEDFFFAFEPDELLPHVMKPRRLTGEQRQQLLQRLYANYDPRVTDVLEQLHRHAPQPKRTTYGVGK